MTRKNKVRKEPRPLDIFCEENFNGSMENTIKYLIDVLNHDNRSKLLISIEDAEEYVAQFNTNEAVFASNVLYDMASENFGGEKEYKRHIKRTVDLDSIGLTEEQIKSIDINPYKAPLKKKFIQIAIVYGGGAIIAVLLNSFDLGDFGEQIKNWVLAIIALFAFWLPLNITPDIIGYFKFKKLKKYYDSEEGKDNT